MSFLTGGEQSAAAVSRGLAQATPPDPAGVGPGTGAVKKGEHPPADQLDQPPGGRRPGSCLLKVGLKAIKIPETTSVRSIGEINGVL